MSLYDPDYRTMVDTDTLCKCGHPLDEHCVRDGWACGWNYLTPDENGGPCDCMKFVAAPSGTPET